jgi:carboxyl-terminal processing protease
MQRAVLFLALLAWPLLALSQAFPSLELTFKLAKERAYRSAQVDWTQVEMDAKSVASANGEDAAIRFVLKSLGDGHSFYRPPVKPSAERLDRKAAGNANLPKPALSELMAPVQGIPVIQINRWSGSHSESMIATASLRSQLSDALDRPVCGLVLDFSTNVGGNMWPMLVGLSPLLTEGVLGYFQDAKGVSRAIEKRGGSILANGSPHPLNGATTQLPRNSANRIAIVVGPRSSSSGEIVPIMFHGQPNVRLFGSPTSGQSTANSSFPLPNGGLANITTATTLNRNRVKFGGKIVPEVTTDQPVMDAAGWIASECHHK